jgi:hypothetical protein
MDTSRKDSEFTPALLYGIDKLDKPRPVRVDLSGQLIIAGQVPTKSTALEDASGGGGETSGVPKVEREIYPYRSFSPGAGVTVYSAEFTSDARMLSVYVNLVTRAGNITPIVQVRHVNIPSFVDLISFGILPAVGVYNLETPAYSKIFRMSFLCAAAGAYAWSAHVVESF